MEYVDPENSDPFTSLRLEWSTKRTSVSDPTVRVTVLPARISANSSRGLQGGEGQNGHLLLYSSDGWLAGWLTGDDTWKTPAASPFP